MSTRAQSIVDRRASLMRAPPAVRSGKHTIVWGAMLSIAWGVAIAWMPEATGAIVMGGVVLAMMTAGQILMVVGHAAQLAEDERQRLRDLDADTLLAQSEALAAKAHREREDAYRHSVRRRVQQRTSVGDAVCPEKAGRCTEKLAGDQGVESQGLRVIAGVKS